MAGANNKAGRGSGGAVAAQRFPVKSQMEVQRKLVNADGRVRFRQQEAGKAQDLAWDVAAGRRSGNGPALQRLADKRVARVKPAQRAADRYRRMAQRAGYNV